MSNIKKWIDEAKQLLAKLSASGQPGVCTFRQGDIAGCETIGFDDSSWKKVLGKGAPIPGIATDSILTGRKEIKLDLCDWSMVDGPAAMRKRLVLADEIEGIATTGSKIYITMTMLAPLEIYIDGKKAAGFRYWGDTRQCELIVTENYTPGTEHVVVFKTPQNDGDAHLGVYFNCEAVEQSMLELSTAVEQLTFVQRLHALHGSKLDRAVDRLEAILDTDAVVSRDWKKIAETLQQIDEALAPIDEYAKEFKIHIIAHSHLDMNWLWDYEDTLDICVRDFRTMCDIMDENPDLRFSQSQTCVYDIVEREDPKTFERVLQKIKEGTWEVTAATWSEHDLNLSGSEIFAHQLLTASDYVRNVLKTQSSRVCWEPDTFGLPATAPNILAKAGIEYFYHFRCGSGNSINWWEGTDGSRLLDFCFGPYNNSLRPTNLMPVTYDLFDKYGLKTAMFVFGVGDHGGGPTRNDIRIKHYLDQKPGLPKLVFSKVCDFFDEALQQMHDYPVVKGEQNFIFEGCYTTKSEIKKLLRYGETNLLNSEAVMALKRMYGTNVSEEYSEIINAWRKVCFNGFHDISCGCNIADADAHDYKIGREAIESAQKIIPNVKEVPGVVTVFNQLCIERDELVCMTAPEGIPETGTLLDAYGQETPYQITNGTLHFVASALPAFSSAGYILSTSACECTDRKIDVDMKYGKNDGSVCTLETSRYSLQVSSRTGTIVTLYDKIEKKDVLQRFKGRPEVSYAFKAEKSSNALMMQYEEPHIMSAWTIGNIKECRNLLEVTDISLVANGPVFATLKVVKKLNDTTFTQFITLYEDLDRIDFDIDVDWHEFGHHLTGVPMLKVGFSSDIKDPEYVYEIPMGNLARTISGSELPALRYVAMCGENRGVVLLNDCKHGFYTEGNMLYMTLSRGSYSPDARPDEGRITASYALLPYYGARDMAYISNEAASFTQKPLSYFGSVVTDGDEYPNLMVEDENVVVTCVKPSHYTDGIIVRIMESHGIRTETGVQLGADFKFAYETDITERVLRPIPCADSVAEIVLMPNEIKTILFER